MVNDVLAGTAEVENVQASIPYRYRSRMDLVTAFGKSGLRRAGSYRTVVDVTSCRIMQEKSDRLYGTIRPRVLEAEGYDYINHEGYLRYIVIREAMYTGQVMVNFVTASRENRMNEVIEAIGDDAHSISLLHNNGLADLSSGEVFDTVKNGFIEETFEDIRYRITPNSFFQSNADAALRIYRRIREETFGKVLDLCAGVGCISLFVAGIAEHVTGVEINREAVDAACINMQANRIERVEFVCSDARAFLAAADGPYDTIIMDPPRSGMLPVVMDQVDRLKAQKVIYMSCNPASFRDDIASLRNYTIESLEAHDMFPQTPHVELLCILRRTG
jgi:tRNA (uracil-5-)-methyltransferase